VVIGVGCVDTDMYIQLHSITGAACYPEFNSLATLGITLNRQKVVLIMIFLPQWIDTSSGGRQEARSLPKAEASELLQEVRLLCSDAALGYRENW